MSNKNIFSRVLDMIGVVDIEEEDIVPEQEPYPPQREPSGRDVQRERAADRDREQPRARSYQQPVRETPREPIRDSGGTVEFAPGLGRGKKASNVVNYPGGDVYRRHTKITTLSRFEEVGDVIDLLLSDISVLLNLEEMTTEEAQRVLDTLTGAAYALSTKINKAAQSTYYLAPANEEVENEYAREDKYARAAAQSRRRGEYN